MTFDPGLAQTRFGYGRSPEVAGPQSVDQMMALLRGPDLAAERFPVLSAELVSLKAKDLAQKRKVFAKAKGGTDAKDTAKEHYMQGRQQARLDAVAWTGAELARRVWTKDAFRERLTAFWADHFPAPGKTLFYRFTAPAYVNSAIRPHVMGKFEDMLISAVLSPQMLHYLDQVYSVGPNSTFAKQRGKGVRGLNENLAREVLELHTLGVDGAYTQQDVRQLAELLTGLTAGIGIETRYRTKRSEPGSETILGKEYQTRRSQMSDIHEVLRDLARHPDTARHIARKIAVHFVSDTPDIALVDVLERRFLETEGDLGAVTEALLRHPAAWHTHGDGVGNFKQPEMFVSSALRALTVPPDRLMQVTEKQLHRYFTAPLRKMGQPWRAPLGPDGFEEADTHWLSPQGLGARLQWALGAPAAVVPDLPDPRDFVITTLGEEAPASVRFAAKAAENRREGIALVLMSPAFQRV
ncbi:DUF1800 family protein [Shimia sp. NS0008-38b]|uniref:DUF1800 domain-containing protein n=1 Tax=Shimia sp. NS0008-38b TaxID=3127653 RepID=UPI0031050B47